MSKYTQAGMTRHQMKAYCEARHGGATIEFARQVGEIATEHGGTRRSRRLARRDACRMRLENDSRACRRWKRHPDHFQKPQSLLLMPNLKVRSIERRSSLPPWGR